MGWKSKMKKAGSYAGKFAWQTNNPWEGLQYAQKRAMPEWGGYFQDNPLSNLGYAWGELTGKNRALDQNQQNLQYQREKYEYDKQLQRDIFAREDNAVFRRKEDLLRSGLSPTLAAGSAAAVGPTVQTTAPRAEPMEGPNIMEAVKLAASLYTMKADVARTFSQIALNQKDMELKDLEGDGKFLDNIIKRTDAVNTSDTGIGKDAGAMGSTIKAVSSWFRNMFNKKMNSRPAQNAQKGVVPKGATPRRVKRQEQYIDPFGFMLNK